jgi:hypothetical protein
VELCQFQSSCQTTYYSIVPLATTTALAFQFHLGQAAVDGSAG